MHEHPFIADMDDPAVCVFGDEHSLDAAWAEAEATLPEEGWMFGVVARGGEYLAEAWEGDEAYACGDAAADTYGPTPAAALRALAVKLRERAR
jgi:hypothetical protein